MARTIFDSGLAFAGGFSSAAAGPVLRPTVSRNTLLSTPSLFILPSSLFPLCAVADDAPGASRSVSLSGCRRKNRIQEWRRNKQKRGRARYTEPTAGQENQRGRKRGYSGTHGRSPFAPLFIREQGLRNRKQSVILLSIFYLFGGDAIQVMLCREYAAKKLC